MCLFDYLYVLNCVTTLGFHLNLLKNLYTVLFYHCVDTVYIKT